jgi:hypothetical protein
MWGQTQAQMKDGRNGDISTLSFWSSLCTGFGHNPKFIFPILFLFDRQACLGLYTNI